MKNKMIATVLLSLVLLVGIAGAKSYGPIRISQTVTGTTHEDDTLYVPEIYLLSSGADLVGMYLYVSGTTDGASPLNYACKILGYDPTQTTYNIILDAEVEGAGNDAVLGLPASITVGDYVIITDVLPSTALIRQVITGTFPATGISDRAVLQFLADSLRKVATNSDLILGYTDTEVLGALTAALQCSAYVADGTSEIDTTLENVLTAIARMETSLGLGWQHLSVTTGLQSVDSTWSSVATHEVFTITGAIEFEIIVTCNVAYTGADSLFIGFAGTYFTRLEKVDADVGEILSINTVPVANVAWVGQVVDPVVNITPTDENSLIQSIYRGISANSLDFGYEIQTASAPAGQMTFNIRWRSLTTATPATVTAAGGGTL